MSINRAFSSLQKANPFFGDFQIVRISETGVTGFYYLHSVDRPEWVPKISGKQDKLSCSEGKMKKRDCGLVCGILVGNRGIESIVMLYTLHLTGWSTQTLFIRFFVSWKNGVHVSNPWYTHGLVMTCYSLKFCCSRTPRCLDSLAAQRGVQ